MTRSIRILAVFLALIALPGSALAQPVPPACPDDRDPGLWDLMNRAIMELYENDPGSIAPLLGDQSSSDRIPDHSAPAIEKGNEQTRALLDALRNLNRDGFSDLDTLDAQLLEYVWSQQLASSAYKQWQMPVTSIAGPQVWLPQMGEGVTMRNREDYQNYLTRLKRVPIAVGDEIDNMRLGIAEGRVPPKVVVEPSIAQALAQATPELREDPARSSFYKPFLSLDPDDPLASEARQIITERIIPVYLELAVFLSNEYLPACRETVGAADGIDGLGAYNALVASHTTLPELSADDIHRIGLDEVERIRAEMFRVIARTDWSGNSNGYIDDDARFAAFVEYLRSDPRFYFDSPSDLLDQYKLIAKAIDPELPKLFSILPRNTYGVRALPDYTAESAPTAYYYPGSLTVGRAGYFMANLSLLDQRPKYDMLALTLHEAVPGHHLQISLAQEIENQHPIRKTMGFTGFVEGWALYAEKLGLEMGEGEHGLYEDPYSDFGRLNFEMWRAMRLVVDTGMHSKGWSREQAVEFMQRNSALSLHNIESEINRYIGWPGQATGYKMGEIEILKIRHQAEQTLGEAFDLRAFHDELLGDGPLPLPVLHKKMDRWIESQRP